MTIFTQRNAIGNISKNLQQSFHVMFIGMQQRAERYYMMSIQWMVFTITVTCVAFTASVIVTLKNLFAPLLVFFALSHAFIQVGYASSPIPMLIASFFAVGISYLARIESDSMATDKSGNSIPKVIFLDSQNSPTSAFAKMFVFMKRDPLWNSFVISLRMISGIYFQSIAFCKASTLCSLKHNKHCLRFNGVSQVKSGELLEPLTCDDEGNQQPSQEYTPGRFRDYRRGIDLLITGLAPDAKAMI